MVGRECKDEGSFVLLNQDGGFMLLKQGYREETESLSMCLGFHSLHSRVPYNIFLEPQNATHFRVNKALILK